MNLIAGHYSPLTMTNNSEIVKYLVEKGADVEMIANKDTPLVAASKRNNFESIKCLV